MKLNVVTSAVALAAVSCSCINAVTLPLKSRAPVPDVYKITVKNLYPEDTVFDKARNLFYQSNLWKGRISVWSVNDNSHFNVLVPGVSSDGDGDQQMAGLSINGAGDKLFAVAKNSAAFRFGPGQRADGADSFHRFNLPVNANSAPVWSISLNMVQTQFQLERGTLPFGPVDSAQDAQDNSYVVFALGMAAIAKVSADGLSVIPWFAEESNGSQRPGYTGIAYIPEDNVLVAFGGPRVLTAFDLNSATPTAIPVQMLGVNFGDLDGTEKLHAIKVNGKSNLFGAKAPNAYRFQSNDRWRTASVRSWTRNEFQTNSLTVVTDASFNGEQQIYGGGAYFGEGAKGGRSQFPLYRIYDLI
ncbi:putative Major allergen Mal f 1 precursor [Mycosarcoma maydis]|uniref:Major allergen Mal f 1 n=1 Tax=Mycosarcoma maydis TaxID=5270 RepID=A0A0D1CJI5_MYCMD|nr:putative Major allergen Mal f 1 precursor [Ustilago maydis 521]KIS67043.1 putative Major allergen Mal f 1 precursor [Ustilago maydis 521]|eukprot:XP_011391238.1 putative Major allergen Mal f 1 precursor [Ustilago maydis 521]